MACLLRWDGDGIEGDSDGDVAAHALIDALLSAAGLGDIGVLSVSVPIPPVPASTATMLRATVAYLRAHGMRPVSASVVVVANGPKIGKRRDEAQQALSHAIGCEVCADGHHYRRHGIHRFGRGHRGHRQRLGGTDRLILSLPAACRFDYFGDNPEQCGNRHDDEARGSGEHGGNQQSTPNGDQTDHGGDDHRGEWGP